MNTAVRTNSPKGSSPQTEKEGHHQALLTEWGRVTGTWWTHKIGGLHRNGCIMAAQTDVLFRDVRSNASIVQKNSELTSQPVQG